MRSIVLVLVTMLLWGVAPVFDKLGVVRVRPEVATFLRSLTVLACVSAYLLASGGYHQLKFVDLRSVGLIAAGGITAGLLAQVAYFHAIRISEASWVVPMAASYPLVTLVLGVVALGEGLNARKCVGALMIVAGLLVMQLGKH